MAEYLPFFMLPVAFGLMFLGVQVAFAMVLTATGFGFLIFGTAVIHQFIEKIDDLATNFVLAAIPLFVFMGAVLEKSGIADRLFEAIHIWTRRLPGGLAIATILMCIVFAASSGVIGATESVVGLLTIPIMLRYGYDKRLISGVICAGGSLGTIIPPSVVVIVMGPLANVSVGDLMYGMVAPGLLMALLYLVYVLVLCVIDPSRGPRIPREPNEPSLSQKLAITAMNLLPPLGMIVAVLGSILGGLASPTEAAAIGCVFAVLLTAFYQRFKWSEMLHALLKTVRVTAMIMAVLLGGTLFTGVFIGGGGIGLANSLISRMDLGPHGLLALLLGIVFLAGFFLDWISIVLIFLPIFTPLVTGAGFDAVWFCILFLIIIQTSYLTPPLAPAIFYLRAVAPPEITMRHMYAGMVPFIILQVLVLGATLYWPQLVTWLPQWALQSR